MSNIEIIQGDCLKVMKSFRDKQFDLVLTDPPYGINAQQKDGKIGGTSASVEKLAGQINHKYPPFDDSKRIDPSELLRVSINQIIWGAEYISDLLPPSRGWLVWYKRINEQSNCYGDCEFAWSSFDKPNRLNQHLWMGFLRDSERGENYHATQKPVEIIKWCLELYTNEGDTILDPFLGSGTTAVACERMGRNCVGIEISPEYCEIARKRVQAEKDKMGLFAGTEK
jgi:DNA modification methylase